MIEHGDLPKPERDAYKRGHRDGYNAGRRVRYRILRSNARTPNPLNELVSDLHELLDFWARDGSHAKAAIPDRWAIRDYLKAHELAEHADRLYLSWCYLADTLQRHGVLRPGKKPDEPDQA